MVPRATARSDPPDGDTPQTDRASRWSHAPPPALTHPMETRLRPIEAPGGRTHRRSPPSTSSLAEATNNRARTKIEQAAPLCLARLSVTSAAPAVEAGSASGVGIQNNWRSVLWI